jgi:quinol monooxygenase YgiN
MERVRALVEYSKTESGTVRYRAMVDIDDPSVVRFFEQYQDAAAGKTHTESDQYHRFVESLPDLVDGTVETIQIQSDSIEHAEFTVADAVDALG